MSNHISPFLYNDNNPSFTPYATSYTDVSLISIKWNDILSKPSFSNICFTSSYYDLSNIPDLSIYASNSSVSSISNILFQNSSNSNLNTSNSVITFTNSKASSIKTSQWTSLNNDIYYNDGNVGIGSSVFGTDKLIVAGTINSDDYKIKGNNISNIFITSNVFNNQSNNLYSNLSNQDYQSSLVPVVSSQWTTDASSNIYLLSGNVGIGTSTFGTDKLIINGSINTQELKLKGLNISNIFITSSNNITDGSNQAINYTNTIFRTFSSNLLDINGTNIYFNLSKNVGIGSSIPKEKLDVDGNLNINGNILPNSCNTYNLGSTNFKWKDLYLSGTSIHIDNININSSNNSLNIKDDITGDFKGLNVSEIRLNSNNKISGIQIDTNGDLKINNKFIVSVTNNNDYSNIIYSNVLNDTSNSLITNINNSFNSINLDTLPLATSNRFITNDSYNRNITFTGTLTASNIISSNLSVIGDTSVFNTTIYQTEQLQVVNDTTATALVVKQVNSNQNISEFYYNNNQLGLLISSNGNIGIGITNPIEKLDISGTINTIGFNLGGVNINTIITSNDTYTSNNVYNNVSNDNYQTSNANVLYSSNSSNTLYKNKQDKLIASTVLLGDGGSITNINYNNLINKPDLSSYTTTTALSTTSNNIYSGVSNLDFSSSNNNFTYSSNRISNIIYYNYQWTSNGNNIYLNMTGNAGIGSVIPSEKLDVSGNINTNELLIKKENISNIFITSNVFENRSNNSYSSLSNQDYISSNNCILYTNTKTANLNIGSGSGSSYWIASGTSNIYVMSNVGIGTTNPQSKLDVLGDINYTGSLKINNTVIPFSTTSNTNISASNAFFSNVNNSYGYYMFLTSGTITFPQATNCDLLLIGAGGNGGLTSGGGGGGSGELIYYPNYPFTIGTSNIKIGYSSFTSNNRITKISSNNVDYVWANGGSDGGYGYNITITGTGNTINTASDNANYKYAFFASNGTFSNNINLTCDILVVGGGGGGGQEGGGGAGAVFYASNVLIPSNTYNIVIGAGGNKWNSANNNRGYNGGNTTAFGITANGGGGGGAQDANSSGNSGGCGGGGGVSNNGANPVTVNNGGIATKGTSSGLIQGTFYGNNGGGAGGYVGGYWGCVSGGGGGAGTVGQDGHYYFDNTQKWGDGGNGIQINITGTNYYWGGGGGGTSFATPQKAGSGGKGGGGAGGFGGAGSVGLGDSTGITSTSNASANNGSSGGAYTGGGGGGGETSGGNGGSGVVIIRYLNPLFSGTLSGSGGGSLYNSNIQSSTGSKWNATYSYSTTGNNGTATQGGSGGSVLATGGYTELITNTSLVIGVGGTGATSSSVPTLKTTYGSGGDGNGGLGTQGLALIKVPLNVQQPIFNGYVYYSNIYNRPALNNILLSSNLITSNFNNQLNFPNANVGWGNEWFLYIGTSPTSVINSFIFNHLTSTINSKWWFNGTTTSTNAEISDERIKYEIQEIPNSLDKLMNLKPKEYYLCDEKDYLKKYGIIAQDVNNNQELNHLVYNDEDYIANVYIYASYINEGNRYILITNSSIIDKINEGDELKLLLNNINVNNVEIIIEETPYHNRYKKRFIKVKRIINEFSFEIYENIELSEEEKSNIFIYGKKVEDFKKLDYSSLYSLNIKATQELYKLIQHQQSIIENLKLRINELENK